MREFSHTHNQKKSSSATHAMSTSHTRTRMIASCHTNIRHTYIWATHWLTRIYINVCQSVLQHTPCLHQPNSPLCLAVIVGMEVELCFVRKDDYSCSSFFNPLLSSASKILLYPRHIYKILLYSHHVYINSSRLGISQCIRGGPRHFTVLSSAYIDFVDMAWVEEDFEKSCFFHTMSTSTQVASAFSSCAASSSFDPLLSSTTCTLSLSS